MVEANTVDQQGSRGGAAAHIAALVNDILDLTADVTQPTCASSPSPPPWRLATQFEFSRWFTHVEPCGNRAGARADECVRSLNVSPSPVTPCCFLMVCGGCAVVGCADLAFLLLAHFAFEEEFSTKDSSFVPQRFAVAVNCIDLCIQVTGRRCCERGEAAGAVDAGSQGEFNKKNIRPKSTLL